MSKIKFRAWINNKKMFYDVDIIDGYPKTNGAVWNGGKLMQYTGLKDKNGKEIYEGDILNSEMINPNNGETHNEIIKANLCMQYGLYEAINFEVIGNIYENKDLIKCQKQNKKNNGLRFPVSVNYFSQNWTRQQQIHPTQKPVALFEYLIKTYTDEKDLVLDNCAGSGTTGVACQNLNRKYILIEQDKEYCKIAEDRLKQKPLF